MYLWFNRFNNLFISFNLPIESLIFLITLSVVFYRIIFFSYFYFGSGPDLIRFTVIFFSFAISMAALIVHGSVLTLFIAWDGLGVRSFFLVAYYINWVSINGAIVTVLTNRFGDFCLFWFFSSYFFTQINSRILIFPIIFLVGAFTKSAQFPFRNWLPLAMAAPTPVSSLVHRSTLVTAGVYIIIRYYYYLENFKFLRIIFMIGLSTIFIAGVRSLLETDIKKIVALRTLSQIGLLVIRLGVCMPSITFCHLITHAFFKRCLFIQIGILIVNFFGNQDGRLFSYSISSSKMTNFIISLCIVSLCGLFFLRGFFSKEAILMNIRNKVVSNVILLLIWGLMILTFFYCFRIIWGIVSGSSVNLHNASTTGGIFFSFLLVSGGSLGGYFIVNNSNICFIIASGLEKFFPLLLFILTLGAFYKWAYGTSSAKNIIFLDNIVSRINSSVNKNLKLPDSFILSYILNINNWGTNLNKIFSRIIYNKINYILLWIIFLILFICWISSKNTLLKPGKFYNNNFFYI